MSNKRFPQATPTRRQWVYQTGFERGDMLAHMVRYFNGIVVRNSPLYTSHAIHIILHGSGDIYALVFKAFNVWFEWPMRFHQQT